MNAVTETLSDWRDSIADYLPKGGIVRPLALVLGVYLLVAVILVSSLMALVYIWRIVETLYFKPALVDAERPGEAPLSLLLVTLAVALANIVFGLWPQFPLSLSSAAAELLVGNVK